MIAEHLFWLHVLGLRDAGAPTASSRTSCSRGRRDDGTWSNWWEGPPDLSTTIEAYVALKLAGVDPGDEDARATSARAGGIPQSRVFTKCFLALLGQWPWQRITPIPVELILLPPSRAVLGLQLRVLGAADRRPAVGRAGAAARAPVGDRPARDRRAAGRDAPAPRPGALRRRAIAAAERWVRERQEADGSWGGIQPPWVWSIVMLAALGHGFEDETLRRAVEGWERLHGRRGRPAAARGVPVAGLGHGAGRARAARRRRRAPTIRALARGRRVAARRGGDGQGRLGGAPARPRARRLGVRVRERPLPGRRRHRRRRARAARARHWARTRSSAGSTGSPGCSPRAAAGAPSTPTTTSYWLYKLPFCDFGAVTDPPSADVTAHALEALAPGAALRRTSVARGLDWLLARAGGRRLVVRPLGRQPRLRHGRRAPGARGLRRSSPRHPAMRRAVAWLDSRPERRRRLRRGHPLVRRSGVARPRAPDAFPNRVGATSLRRCRRGAGGGRAASGGVPLRRAATRTATGTSSTTPARAFPATS